MWYDTDMAAEIHQNAIVREGGRVEIVSSELHAGEQVHVIIRRNGQSFDDTDGPTAETLAEMFGQFRGKIWMSDDFDAPLEDFKDYM